MGRLPSPALRRAVRSALAATAALPLPLLAATTMTVTVNVSSTVAASPGTCLFLPAAADPAVLSAAALDFAVACSGSGPYFVAIEGADSVLTRLPLTIGGSDAAGRTDASVRQIFTKTWPLRPLVCHARPLRCAVIATVQY